jgi:hypothetical protein
MNTTAATVNESTANTNKQQNAKEVIAANVQALIEQLERMRLSNAPVIPLVLVVHLSHERSGSSAEATQPSRS